MKFLVDAQLPPLLANWLVKQGHEATHVFDVKQLCENDRLIWAVAQSTGAVIVTKDRDFVRFREQADGPQILYLGVPNLSNTKLIATIEINLQKTVFRLKAGQAIVVLS